MTKESQSQKLYDKSLEAEFLELWRDANEADRRRISKLLSGVLAGKVTLTLAEASTLVRAEVVALADTLPDHSPKDWMGLGQKN